LAAAKRETLSAMPLDVANVTNSRREMPILNCLFMSY
jgi:hypothetical protein